MTQLAIVEETPPTKSPFVTGMLDTWFATRVGRPPRKDERSQIRAIAEQTIGQFEAIVAAAGLLP